MQRKRSFVSTRSKCLHTMIIFLGTVDQYEIGDLSGKYGTIGNRDDLSLVYYDYNLPLFGGNSILFRSLVIHYNNGSRWACTNINPKNATFHVKAKSEFIGPAFNGTISVVSLLEGYRGDFTTNGVSKSGTEEHMGDTWKGVVQLSYCVVLKQNNSFYS